MREKILEVINNKPKHYVTLIKKDTVLFKWVMDNTLITNDVPFIEHIRSSVYNETNMCPHGNQRKIQRINNGWVNCGPSSICKCTKETIANNVSATKKCYTQEQNDQINQRRIQTMRTMYGVDFNSQRDDIKPNLKISKLETHQYNLLNDIEWVRSEYCDKNRSSVDIANQIGCHDSTVRNYVRLHGFDVRQRSNYSLEERKISEWLKSINVDHECGKFGLLKGRQEIDIYLPYYNLGIEVNGLLYHGYNPTAFHCKDIDGTPKKENREKHLKKTLNATDNGVKLIHFTDHQINNQWDIVKDIIASKLGMHQRISARECSVSIVSKEEQKKFFDNTHLQGYVSSNQAWGLYYNGNLIQCISTGRNRWRKDEIEILRFSSNINITVVGGLSKLLKRICAYYPNETITTYCDRDISVAKGYLSCGFKIVGYSNPGYFWTDGNNIISRYRCQKKQLAKWLEGYDSNLSESQNMFRAGFLRFWNCGNIVLKYEK